MARALRIQIAGAYYHVTCPGNERKAIFRDETDRQAFLDRLRGSLTIYQVYNTAVNSPVTTAACMLNSKTICPMKLPVLLSTLVVTVQLAVGVIAFAQPLKKVPRVGYLSSADSSTEFSRATAIRLALRELGHVDGKNVATEYRFADWKFDRVPELAAELVRLKVDVIVVASGTLSIQAAMRATQTIPIVMVGQGIDPVEAGFIKNLAHPGGNVTGLALLTREVTGKRLKLLKGAVPKIARVAVVYDPANAGSVVNVRKILPNVAGSLGLTIQSWEVRDAASLERVLAAMGEQRPDGLYVFGGTLLSSSQKLTVGFALKNRLPAMYSTKDAVEAGGLMSYGPDLADSFRLVARYVDKILKGAMPADLPVQGPRKFEFAVSLKTAKQIGLTIPPNVLVQADRVIK